MSAVRKSLGSDVEPGVSVNHGTKLDGVGINPLLGNAIPPLRSDCQIAFLGSMVPWFYGCVPGAKFGPKHGLVFPVTPCVRLPHHDLFRCFEHLGYLDLVDSLEPSCASFLSDLGEKPWSRLSARPRHLLVNQKIWSP